MRQYRGVATDAGCTVTVEEGVHSRVLDPRSDLRNHSPTGFAWGYGGSGPAQLALARCADATGDDDRAQDVYQQVKFRVVATLPAGGWVLSEREVLEAVHAAERERAAQQAAPDPDAPAPEPAVTPLTRRLDRHLAALAAERPADATDREAVVLERGWMEAVRHLTARGGLTHAGRVEADKLLAASRDWLREQRGDPAGELGR